jgi:competence protein ComEA
VNRISSNVAAARRQGLALGGGLLGVVASISVMLASAAVPEASAPASSDAANAALLAQEQQSLQAVCGSKCHRLELFATARKSYQDWHETVQKMVDRGADGSDDQFLDIMDYLYRTQTIIDVNAAAAEDLGIVLGVSPAQAQAIVARRAKKKFSSLEDLKSVSGLDAAKLDAKAGLLVFQ